MMKRFQRVVALLGVAVILLLVVLTLFFGITGSRYFMGTMLTMFFVPILLWSYFFIYNMAKKKDEQDSKKCDSKKDKDK